MKIAILANDGATFVKPMADSLTKMFFEMADESIVHYIGKEYLKSLAVPQFWNNPLSYLKTVLIDIAKIIVTPFMGNRYRRRVLFVTYKELEKDISTSDVIIVVEHLPTAFLPSLGIEELRRRFSIPIILYDLVNLTLWPDTIIRIQNQGGFGLERYDWYLYISNIGECPLPKFFDAFSLIGVDLRGNTLYPGQKDFFAILDFPRKGFENERAIQIQALEETNTNYYQLDRLMTIEEIRKIYRKSCIFFLSFEETFGLPIVELQLCGSYIGTPYKKWAPSHYINKNVYEKGEGDLGKNFIVYNNDKETLKNRIIQIRSNYDPQAVIKEFADTYPHLYHGDSRELRKFIDLVKRGIIHADSHRSYDRFNQ
jgi:hypothetical protein